MSDAAALHAAIERFAAAKVVVLGDVMLDRYVYGQVSRVSQEAPIPVLRVGRESPMPGGAGNVAHNLAVLGAEARLIGLVGNDEAGHSLQQFTPNGAGRLINHLVVDPDRRTTVKTRFVAAGQQLLRADEEDIVNPSKAVEAALLRRLDDALADADVLVISDYAKGVLSDQVLRSAIDRARAARCQVIADPKRTELSAYSGVHLLKPNRAELAAATGLTLEDDAGLVEAARRVMAEAGVNAMLISRSELGVTLVETGQDARHWRAEAREVYDVSGAGDTMVAVLACVMAAGGTMAEAAYLANVAAGIVVGLLGTATVSPDRLAAALRHADLGGHEAKVMSRQTAAEQVAEWRRLGLRIGFTNGCFDLLHPGHVSLLRQARRACDRLIVGLNDDGSVRRLKGEGRPVQDETARALVLASLADVDQVVPFAEDTPLALIDLLRPDVLVKGADYTREQVVGHAEVESWGGRVLLADLAEGHSTSRTIARLGNGSGGGGR
ncbi:MAG: D-glycero-beta-D-manno-heptose-7-phosphate kinase [Alphaproteobacteria bacterium]